MAESTATTTATGTGTGTTLRSGTVITGTAATGTAAAPGAAAVAAVAAIATAGGGGGSGGGGAAGGGGAGGAPVGGGVPVPFALEPAALDSAPLNYATKAGLKKYELAMAKLNNEFNGKSTSMTLFKGDLQMHASKKGRDNNQPNADIIHIPNQAGTRVFNLVTEYSQLSHDDLIFWANVNIVGQGTRAAQNNANMYRCLYNTTTPELLSRLQLEAHLHHIGETPIAAMYYNQMMGFANVDTEATISLTRQQLSTLDVKMIELNSNIRVFNSYVQELLSKLHQHGTTSEDTLTKLFRGYRAAQVNFHSFILDIERKFFYGIDQVTVTQLTARARTAYQVEKGKGI